MDDTRLRRWPSRNGRRPVASETSSRSSTYASRSGPSRSGSQPRPCSPSTRDHASYDADAVTRFLRVLQWSADVFTL